MDWSGQDIHYFLQNPIASWPCRTSWCWTSRLTWPTTGATNKLLKTRANCSSSNRQRSWFAGTWLGHLWVGSFSTQPRFLKDMHIQVVPGRAGGGSFRRKKNYIAKKEFAYRMCARRPTSAMPKPFLCCERAFCCSMVVMWPVLMHVMSFDVVVMSFDAMWLLVLCHVTWCNAMSCDVPCNGHVVCSKWFCDNVVIQSTILYYKVLLCTTKYYSSTTLYYRVLLQYYSVLQRTTPVLLCTTKYYSSTTLYCKVLLQYYSVLQSTTQYYSVLQRTTPVLPCTTKYYSSTTLYCKVLLQYYPVLQSTIPVLLCTTKYYSSTTLYYKVLLQYYSVLQSTTPILLCTNTPLYYTVLQRTTPVLLCTTTYYSSTTLYYKVLLQYYSVLQSTTPVLPCTTKYYSSTTLYYKVLLQYYSVVHSATTYYSSITLYYKAAFIWTVIYMIDVRRIWNVMYNARSNRSHPPTSPNTAPATQNDCEDWSASHMKRHLQCAEQQDSQSNFTKYCACHAKWIPWLIRVSHMKRHLECAEQQESPSTFTKYCACHAKWISWLIRLTYETSFRMRGASKVNLEPHQILRLPRKMHLMIDPRHIWNVI